MIEIQHLSKSFQTADGQVDALQDVNLSIGNGEIYGVIGMSGAGKVHPRCAASTCLSARPKAA